VKKGKVRKIMERRAQAKMKVELISFDVFVILNPKGLRAKPNATASTATLTLSNDFGL
jgi:hypothetical protein